MNGNLPSHWKNNAMAATKHANCARDHRPEPMDLRPVARGGSGGSIDPPRKCPLAPPTIVI